MSFGTCPSFPDDFTFVYIFATYFDVLASSRRTKTNLRTEAFAVLKFPKNIHSQTGNLWAERLLAKKVWHTSPTMLITNSLF